MNNVVSSSRESSRGPYCGEDSSEVAVPQWGPQDNHGNNMIGFVVTISKHNATWVRSQQILAAPLGVVDKQIVTKFRIVNEESIISADYIVG